MKNFGDFIDETISSFSETKNKLDRQAFFKFLKAELEQKRVALTINRSTDLLHNPLVCSDIVGVELDLSEHDKKKDAEIEKYKKSFEFAKQERDEAVCEYQNEIDRLKSRVKELEESQEKLPGEPIKMADWIVHHFKQGLYPGYERDDNGNVKCVELVGEKIPLQTGKYENYTEVEEIADYLLAYCKYHSEED